MPSFLYACESLQSCLTLCDAMDCSRPGSSVRGILQANSFFLSSCCHFFLQRIFLTQGSNAHLLHLLNWQANSLPLHHLSSPGNSLHSNYLSNYLDLDLTTPNTGPDQCLSFCTTWSKPGSNILFGSFIFLSWSFL